MLDIAFPFVGMSPMIIFPRVPVHASGVFCLDPATEFYELLQKSASSGSMERINFDFSIVCNPSNFCGPFELVYG
jgi:hypothetical protein